MASRSACTPWLINVVRRAGLAGVDQLTAEPQASLDDSWAAVQSACGVGDGEVSQHVAKYFRLGVADFKSTQPQAIKLLPEEMVRKHRLFPLRQNDTTIHVATCDPMDGGAEQSVGFASGRRPIFEIASPSALSEAIGLNYSTDALLDELLKRVHPEVADAVRVLEEIAGGGSDEEEETSRPVIRIANLIISEAIAQRASDIHIEPGAGQAVVRYRIDGVLRTALRIPAPVLGRVVARLKVMAKMDIADRLRPQDGRARVEVEGRMYDLRTSTVPLRDAEKVVIRVLDPRGSLRLEDTGMSGPELVRFRHLLTFREGIVFVTGPTGSGKTTTLYAAIRELATGEVNITTVEDPVEYEQPGIAQIQVDVKRNLTFASALRAILRQDPDVILVGEIRDLETAEIAVQAAMTGHLVLATLHTNDAVGVVSRLTDLGLDRASISAALRGAVAQRLVRSLCVFCAEPAVPPLPEEIKLGNLYGVMPAKRAVGCDHCEKSGYRGRIPITEVLSVTGELREGINHGSGAAQLERLAIDGGLRKLKDVALERVKTGETSLQEVERVLGYSSEAPSGEDRTEAAIENDTRPHILLVDDDPETRILARTLLQKEGYRTTEAADGVEAIQKLSSSSISLVVLDLTMPKLSGEEVLATVRSSPATSATPVVVLTGEEDEKLEARLMDQGADDYIRKPIDPYRFVARVRAALRRAGVDTSRMGAGV